MKARLPLLSLSALLLGASAARAGLVINEIDVVNNKIEIVNRGPGAENLTNFWFCNFWKGDNLYISVANFPIVLAQSTATSLNMPAGSILVLQGTAGFVTDLQGELGLYATGNFGDPNDMRDYVCWGGDSNLRDDVAAAKGIWQAATFVPITIPDLQAGKSIQLKLNEDGNSASDYELAAPTLGVDQTVPVVVDDHLVISEIDLANDQLEIINTGTGTKSLTGYYLCNIWQGSPAYIQIESSMIVAAKSTTTTLDIGAGGLITLQLTAAFVTNGAGEMGLYRNTNNFGDSANMQDYVSWGGDAVRDEVAAQLNIWVAGSSVSVSGITTGQTIQLKEGEDGNSASDYQLATGTIGFNQVYPPPVEPQDQIAFRVRSLTFNGSGDLVIHFTPGEEEGPFILTSSNDLASPFTEETHAVYNAGQGTFTVPAAYVNPFMDFYKVETFVE